MTAGYMAQSCVPVIIAKAYHRHALHLSQVPHQFSVGSWVRLQQSNPAIPAASARLADTDDIESRGVVVTLWARMGVAWIDAEGVIAGEATCTGVESC